MQGLGSRSKTTLDVCKGLTTGLGPALFTSRTVPRHFFKYIRTPRKSNWDMSVKVANNESQCISLLQELKRDVEVSKVLGFDCEWVQIDNKRNPVALLQLATKAGQCGLFQIHFYSSIPDSLQDILTDKSIMKVGVDPAHDAKYLLRDYGIHVAGTFDIRHLVDGDWVGGLAAIVSAELGVELSKDLAVRVSNWEAKDLTQEQQVYAANDALASLMAFNKLIDKKVKVPFFSSKEEQWKKIYDHCFPFLDTYFKDKRNVASINSERGLLQTSERHKSGQPRSSVKILPGKRSYSVCPRKSPLYENFFMLAPDGDILCTCDRKKAEWYVSKGLAAVVDLDPSKIQLKFEPSGRVNGPSAEYYTLAKENQCVTCGRKDSYLRKKIVPHEYRRYFPDCMKKHQSHDVLLLCTLCHARSNIFDLDLRLKLAEICNAPLAADENSPAVENSRKKTLRSAARALLNKTHKLPEKRREELTNFIQESCQSDVTLDLLNSLRDMDIMVVNEDFTPHGLVVVEYFAREGINGLMKLEKMWREHFISVMDPKHLPPLWSVDHYHEKEREFTFDSYFLDRMKLISLAQR